MNNKTLKILIDYFKMRYPNVYKTINSKTSTKTLTEWNQNSKRKKTLHTEKHRITTKIHIDYHQKEKVIREMIIDKKRRVNIDKHKITTKIHIDYHQKERVIEMVLINIKIFGGKLKLKRLRRVIDQGTGHTINKILQFKKLKVGLRKK